MEYACEGCGNALRSRRQPPWRYSLLSTALFLAAGSIGLVFFFVSSHAAPLATLGPAAMIAAVALGLPRVRVVRCEACGWSRKIRSGRSRSASRSRGLQELTHER